MLTDLEKKVIAAIQDDIKITKSPYCHIASKLDISEPVLLDHLKNLAERGIIRRFGATIRHQKSGFQANAMVAWKADEKNIDTIGQRMAAYRQVSHCYRRNPHNGWPFNLYTMIHAKNKETCRAIAQKISKETSVENYLLLFSTRELKKTSMKYFSSDI